MRLIAINNVTNEMKLARPIMQDNSAILLNIGCTDLVKYKEKLQEMGIHYLYINDDVSIGIEVDDIITEKTRNESRKIIHKAFDNISKRRNIKFNDISKSIEDIVNNILLTKKALVNLVDLKNNDNYTYFHSVNVAVLAIIVGKALHYDYNNLVRLGTGAILHDLGKSLIPSEILHKKGPLTDEEFKYMKDHPSLGYSLIKSSTEICSFAKNVILSHHEHINGSGYPRRLKGDEIHEMAKIITVCDVYDALTSDRCYRKRWPSYQAMEYLIAHTGEYYDHKIVDVFIKNIATFPIGSTVTLSDGRLGIVERQTEYPTRPVVRVTTDIGFETINLLEQLNIVIIDSE